MGNIPTLKGKDFLKYLLKFNCKLIDDNGSHHTLVNLQNNKHSVVAFHGGNDIKPIMFKTVLKQLDINLEEFLKFIYKK
ncbi:MAG: type II toxin-antitoxin system HicA family toxin [Firmicutes bacterium]|nr:type II toxin-antitoxin system HicA family toxin [Bacillota bacterium]